jgi:hypothetical protein
MSRCNELVKAEKTGNVCLKQTLSGSIFCERHARMNELAEPIVPGNCKWIRKNYKRCENLILENDDHWGFEGKDINHEYCRYHQKVSINNPMFPFQAGVIKPEAKLRKTTSAAYELLNDTAYTSKKY